MFQAVEAELFDITKDRKMFLDCQGTGVPTVVFISGRTDRSDIWKEDGVFQAVAKFTRACAYDRPGTFTISQETIEPSRSTSVAQPTTPLDGVKDLHALLTQAKVAGPYVLVAHSYGGLIARLYAITYPDEVVGLVLIDTLTEFLYDRLTPSQQKLWIQLNSNYSPELDAYAIQERTDFIPSFDQLRNKRPHHLIPTIVLTSDQPYDFKSLMAQGVLPPDAPINFGPIVFQTHLEGQQDLSKLLKAKHITDTNAGHYIQLEQPQLVIDAIREVFRHQIP